MGNHSNASTKVRLNRRTALRGAVGSVAAAVGLRTVGASGAQGTPTAGQDGHVPSGVPGVADAYTELPEPFQTVAEPPGRGERVQALLLSYAAPPPSRDDNQYWQELEARLNVEWEPILAPQPNYGEKASTVIAGGDLPDFFYLNYNQTLTPLAKFVEEGVFLDLTPFVTGDALQAYPNLAQFPDFMWQATMQGGKIFGVPRASGRSGSVPFYRKDWADTLGVSVPEDAQQVRDLLLAMSQGDPDGNGNDDTWGTGKYGTSWGNSLVEQMFRVPNGWRLNDDGTLTHASETEEYRLAIDYIRQLNADGAYHPDSAAMNYQEARENFVGGRTGFHNEGFGSFFGGTGIESTIQTNVNANAALDALIPPGHDGGEGVTHNLSGIFGFTAIPASRGDDEERVQELLRILDYFAAPFGSEEWIFLNYGLEDEHHTVDASGLRIGNEKLGQEKGDFTGLTNGLLVSFFPDKPEDGPRAMEIEKRIVPIGIDDPTMNLYSPTALTKGSELSQLRADTITNIITGRDEIDALDEMIEEWRSRGGDDIRAEFQEALAAQ